MTYDATVETYGASAGGARTITAFFDNRNDADQAVEDLVAAGIARGQVRLVPGNEPGSAPAASGTRSDRHEGGFWDALKDLFLPDEDRFSYAEGLKRGGYLVTVTTTDANYDTAIDILDDEGTIDIGEREQTWRSEGWGGYADRTSAGAGLRDTSGSTGFARDVDIDRTRDHGDKDVIPLAEEELRIGKRDVSHGRVRVRSYVVETPISEQVDLGEEHVNVTRRPVDRAATDSDRLFQDRTIDVEEHGEEAVVSKEARVREEIVVDKDVDERTETVSDTVRRTEVDIEDDRAGKLAPAGERISRTR